MSDSRPCFLALPNLPLLERFPRSCGLVEKFFNGERRSKSKGREGRAMGTLRRECRRGVRRRKSGELVGAIISAFLFWMVEVEFVPVES
jgi:hypothetical protein